MEKLTELPSLLLAIAVRNQVSVILLNWPKELLNEATNKVPSPQILKPWCIGLYFDYPVAKHPVAVHSCCAVTVIAATITTSRWGKCKTFSNPFWWTLNLPTHSSVFPTIKNLKKLNKQTRQLQTLTNTAVLSDAILGGKEKEKSFDAR